MAKPHVCAVCNQSWPNPFNHNQAKGVHDTAPIVSCLRFFVLSCYRSQ
jgi:hypothetical protein